jgi:DNA topoisomerase-2
MSAPRLKVKKFFDTQFKQYARYDNDRSIANAIDGQKITMRKVLYTCSNRSNSEIKVSALASLVAYETDYHHGDIGIGGVIVNLAQDFPGSNNVNFLAPLGQFGSRLGPENSSYRYIYTELMPSFRSIFKKEDELILEHNYSDDLKIEPKFYLPILPVVLINGSQGIGTGFASKVLQYNPDDLRKDILAVLNGKKRKKLVPWFKGFTGTVEEGDKPGQWIISGKLEVLNTTTIKITELPIGTFPDDMKKVFLDLKEKQLIKDFDDNSDDLGYNMSISCPRTTTALDIEELYKMFNLVSRESENLTLWTHNDTLRKFSSASEIVDYFASYRIDKYEVRRLALIKEVEEEILDIDERIRFIQYYLGNTRLFKDTSKKELLELLLSENFNSPERLLAMQIWSLTKDKIEEMKKLLERKITYLETLQNDTAQNMFITELEDLKL